MKIAETLNEGLKRAYLLTIPARDIEARVDAEVRKVAPQVRMPGFRPGKVPANLVRKMHGPAIQQEALNTAIQEGVQQLLGDRQLRPAMQPAVELGEDYAAGKDAQLTVALEVLPDVPAPMIDDLALERLTVEPGEAAIDAQLGQFAEQQKRFEPAPKGHKAAHGHLVVMDFAGKVDGEPFEGGTGQGMSVEIGSGRMIPGFEDQLIGVTANDEKTISVTFPDDYNVAYLKGRPATFDLVINEVHVPQATPINDEFARSMGLESLEQLRGAVKGQIEQELSGLTRTHMKRKLLDRLAADHDFAVPPSMVDAEFEQIWRQLEHEASHEADPAAALKEMEADRDDYRRIAERRVRLGLLLSEIGRANAIEVNQAEMSRLVSDAAMRYDKGDRDRFIAYIQNDPMAAAQLRAPLYEDKVVDFLFGKAAITDRAATREELEAAIEADEGAGHVHGPGCGHDHAPAPKAKAKPKSAAKPTADDKPVPPAKKAAAKPAKAQAAPAEKAPVQKPAVKKPAAKAKA